MTIQEALAEGLSVTGVGLAIVFSVLVILMLVMMAMKKIFYKDPAKAKAAAPVVAPAPAVKAETKVDEGELIAVLTAAIAASLNTSTYNLQIKSYRRIENNKPLWNRAGVSETINSRY
ncbi:MAG: OadG family protein [Clostridia bacterium]|nr:OadG family protein [Clostridia bacterium]